MEGITSRPKILVCATGSVAAVKIPEIVSILCQSAEVRVVLTEHAKHFVHVAAKSYNPDAYKAYLDCAKYYLEYTDQDEWDAYLNVKADPVVHIELRKWADLMVVAPLSANTLGKMAAGICDNLLTSIIRAWDLSKPLIVAPAMNTHMWDHPFTGKHLDVVKSIGVQVIDPVSKTLACGDTGNGAMATVESIIQTIKSMTTHMAAESTTACREAVSVIEYSSATEVPKHHVDQVNNLRDPSCTAQLPEGSWKIASDTASGLVLGAFGETKQNRIIVVNDSHSVQARYALGLA